MDRDRPATDAEGGALAAARARRDSARGGASKNPVHGHGGPRRIRWATASAWARWTTASAHVAADGRGETFGPSAGARVTLFGADWRALWRRGRYPHATLPPMQWAAPWLQRALVAAQLGSLTRPRTLHWARVRGVFAGPVLLHGSRPGFCLHPATDAVGGSFAAARDRHGAAKGGGHVQAS